MPRKIGLPNLVVNGLGEVIGKDEVVAGSVNDGELTARLGRRPTTEDFDREFRRMAVARLTPIAAHRVLAVWRLQKHNNGRFRVWMARSGRVLLSTEFIGLIANKDLWTKIDAAAKELGRLDVMFEGRHLDKTSKDGGKTWITGPDHGKRERQVSIDILLPDYLSATLKRVRAKAERITQEVWDQAGVAVV